jgi:transcriptional regulator with XRE-family HTH domain
LKALRSAAAQATVNVIKSAREEYGLTQRDLAARMEWNRGVIGSLEVNQRQVNIPEFIAIAEEIGADPVELFTRVICELRKLERLSTATLAGRCS